MVFDIVLSVYFRIGKFVFFGPVSDPVIPGDATIDVYFKFTGSVIFVSGSAGGGCETKQLWLYTNLDQGNFDYQLLTQEAVPSYAYFTGHRPYSQYKVFGYNKVRIINNGNANMYALRIVCISE